MVIHIVLHEEFEAPGAIFLWAKRNGHVLTFTRLYECEKLPDQLSYIDLVIIMGGPQSPDSSLEEYPYFDAQNEIKWIRKVVNKDKTVLGICLGAQLIGEALGASYEQSPHREIGVFFINLTEVGRNDPFFSTMPEIFPVGHWHGDMPGLTADSEVLAFSEGCPRQIVRYTSKVYGFQCHMEFTQESMAGMISSCSDDLKDHHLETYVESPEKLKQLEFDQMNRYLFGFLDYLESLSMKEKSN